LRIIKNFLVGFIIVILSLIIAYTVSELCIRIVSPQMTGPIQFAFNPELGAIPVPKQRAMRSLPGCYSYTYSNNQLGLRGNKDYDVTCKKCTRILLLGDSFTYGIGVNDDQTFGSIIENNLLTKFGLIEVINGGNGGKGTDYALKFFQLLGHEFEPDITILCFFCNDYADNIRNDYFIIDNQKKLHYKKLNVTLYAKKSFLIKIPFYDWFISWSHAANLLKNAAMKLIDLKKGNGHSDSIISYKNSEKGFADEKSIQITKLFILELNKLLLNKNSKFIIVYIPMDREIIKYRNYHEISYDEINISKITNELNIKYLSLTPLISNSMYNINELYYREGHWTPEAHYIAANYLTKIILDIIKK